MLLEILKESSNKDQNAWIQSIRFLFAQHLLQVHLFLSEYETAQSFLDLCFEFGSLCSDSFWREKEPFICFYIGQLSFIRQEEEDYMLWNAFILNQPEYSDLKILVLFHQLIQTSRITNEEVYF